jgi:Mg-chelatase subunit ChlD
VIVVMTDGYENASREADLKTARAALARAEGKGWQVVFLGADFNNFAQARELGLHNEKRINMARGHQVHAMRLTAEKSLAYLRTGEEMEYFDQDRTESGEDKVK